MMVHLPFNTAVLRACALNAASCSGISLGGLKWSPCVQAYWGRKVVDYHGKMEFRASCASPQLALVDYLSLLGN